MEDLKIVFMGTPQFALPCLRALIQARHQVAAVYTQPPRKSGRGQRQTPSSVHQYAGQHGLRVLTPTSLQDTGVQEELLALKPDAIVVSAYGLIVPKALLDAPRLGCLNVHPSLLPRWRGAAPIQRTIMAGDSETGVTIMKMDEGLDTGPMIITEKLPVGDDMTTGDLHDALAEISGPLMLKALEGLAEGELKPVPQLAKGAVYAPKITAAEEKIDWSRTATDIHNQIRALAPEPGAHFSYKGEDIKIFAACVDPNITSGIEGSVIDRQFTISCGQGSISPTLLQRPGRKPMPVKDFLNGFAVKIGTILE